MYCTVWGNNPALIREHPLLIKIGKPTYKKQIQIQIQNTDSLLCVCEVKIGLKQNTIIQPDDDNDEDDDDEAHKQCVLQ